MHTIGFLEIPVTTAEVQRIFDEDVAELGYVMNVSRLWAYQPATATALFNLVRQAHLGGPPQPSSAFHPRRRVRLGVRRLVLLAGLGIQTGRGNRCSRRLPGCCGASTRA